MNKCLIIFSLFLIFIKFTLFGIEPSPREGGGVLIIDNQTSFTIRFPEGVPTFCKHTACYYTKNALSMSSSLSFDPIAPGVLQELTLTWLGLPYWFGAPGYASGELIITSDSWPIPYTIVLKKYMGGGQVGAFDPLRKKDSEGGRGYTPRITWVADWDQSAQGWRITLKESAVETGVVTLEEFDFVLKDSDFDEL